VDSLMTVMGRGAPPPGMATATSVGAATAVAGQPAEDGSSPFAAVLAALAVSGMPPGQPGGGASAPVATTAAVATPGELGSMPGEDGQAAGAVSLPIVPLTPAPDRTAEAGEHGLMSMLAALLLARQPIEETPSGDVPAGAARAPLAGVVAMAAMAANGAPPVAGAAAETAEHVSALPLAGVPVAAANGSDGTAMAAQPPAVTNALAPVTTGEDAASALAERLAAVRAGLDAVTAAGGAAEQAATANGSRATDAAAPASDAAVTADGSGSAALNAASVAQQTATPQATTATPAAATATAQVDATSGARLAEGLADSIQGAVRRGDRELRLVLNPPELGEVHVRVTEGAMGVRVAIEAASREAHDLIQRRLPALRDGLVARDLLVDRLDVQRLDRGLDDGGTSPGAFAGHGSGHGSGQGAGDGSQSGWANGPEWSPVAGLNLGGSVATTGSRKGASEVTPQATAGTSTGRLDVLA